MEDKKWIPDQIENDNRPKACPAGAYQAYRKALGDSTPMARPAATQDGENPEDLNRRVHGLSLRVDRMMCDRQRLMNLIGEVLQEAQDHPQRLTAFNSPLLGLLLLEHHAHISKGDLDWQSYDRFRAVVNARNSS